MGCSNARGKSDDKRQRRQVPAAVQQLADYGNILLIAESRNAQRPASASAHRVSSSRQPRPALRLLARAYDGEHRALRVRRLHDEHAARYFHRTLQYMTALVGDALERRIDILDCKVI
jgi:hypothetical protein